MLAHRELRGRERGVGFRVLGFRALGLRIYP